MQRLSAIWIVAVASSVLCCANGESADPTRGSMEPPPTGTAGDASKPFKVTSTGGSSSKPSTGAGGASTTGGARATGGTAGAANTGGANGGTTASSGGAASTTAGSPGTKPGAGGSSPTSNGTGGSSARGGSSSGGATPAQGGATAGAGCPTPTRARLKNGECVDRIKEFSASGAPTSIAVGTDKMLWFDDGAGQLIKMDTLGQIQNIVGVGDAQATRDFATGSEDTLIWFTDSLARTLSKVSTKDQLPTSYPLTFKPLSIARGPDNNFWITEFDKAVYRFTITDTGPVPQRWDAHPVSSIVAGPDGNLWFANAETLVKLKPDGTQTESSRSIDGFIEDICVGPDGALWFTETFYSRIGRVDTNGKADQPIELPLNTNPGEIVAGPDRALWFIEKGPNQIGRISVEGKVTHYPLSTHDALGGIVLGPDGNLWFTETSAGKIARLIPDQ